MFLWSSISLCANPINCWFPPGWKNKRPQALAISQALSKHSGISIKPKIANSYPQIISAFSKHKPNIVYVGSFVQAILNVRKLGTPLVQMQNGKEYYSGILVYPKDLDPVKILLENPRQIAFAMGASSGESAAKAATAGKATIAGLNHSTTCSYILKGTAKAGVVKNWWWDKNRSNYPNLASYQIPEVSVKKNPDNILTVSNAITTKQRKKIIDAARASIELFGATEIIPFDPANLLFTINLMKKANLDPMTINW